MIAARRRRRLAWLAAPAILVSMHVGGARAQDATRRRGFSVKITHPVNQDFVIGRTRIAADVRIDRPEAVEKVEFYVANALVFIDSEPPYECIHDFGPESREVVVRAVAHHRESLTVSDFVVTRKLDVSFAIRVNRVILNASVFDKDGAFLTGLTRDDFVVTEGGAPRQIIDFAPEARPILMGILIDVSGSMQEEMDEVHAAAGGFVDSLRDVDRAMLVEFNEKVYLLSELTSDRAAIRTLIQSTKALGGTAMYDAVHATLRRLAKFDARKALIVLSDGDDTQSSTQYKDLLEEVKMADATIFAIALGSGFADVDSRGRLKELAEQTGGRLFQAAKASDLAAVYGRIADELRHQYYITYASENERFDGRWIPIRIDVGRKGSTVRTRQGYFAAPPKAL